MLKVTLVPALEFSTLSWPHRRAVYAPPAGKLEIGNATFHAVVPVTTHAAVPLVQNTSVALLKVLVPGSQ